MIQKITVTDVAKELCVASQAIRVMLQTGKCPFGTAVKLSSKWTYIIYPEKYREYIRGHSGAKKGVNTYEQTRS